jgi:putative transposase
MIMSFSEDHNFKCEVEISQKPESPQGFVPESDCWQVERSFVRLNSRRRLYRDL